MSISDSQNKTAGELVDLVTSRVGSNGAVHPETAIASIARLAGSLLLRSFNLNIDSLEPGTVILSTEANEKGPQLIGIMSSMLQQFGLSMDKEKLGGEQSKLGTKPDFSTVQSLSLLQDDAIGIAKSNGLELKEAAQSAAMATAFFVKECANDIGVETGFNVAAYNFIDGCKTVPPAIGSTPKADNKKPWYKFW
ncbi:hypothetical protein Pla110_02500 [Polystyrenella longa]|uniref:Uncharacterized protein n=1 Tax=Polystyrenella longa TaxID=2528007 RepID=A0A518CH45_9PLAN|nr:hypothetical protein [Polystyrenella longa]QDU78546.1 hypothetical protein Pla110_02500 [Polystyrenella longa]